jgi:hypothetical protein
LNRSSNRASQIQTDPVGADPHHPRAANFTAGHRLISKRRLSLLATSKRKSTPRHQVRDAWIVAEGVAAIRATRG